MASDAEGPRRHLRRACRAGLVGLGAPILVWVMLRLSPWQWDKAQAQNRLLNYTYAVEWAISALLVVVGLARLAVEDARLAQADQEREGQTEAGAWQSGSLMIGPPMRPGEAIEELTWVRLQCRAGLDRR